MIVYSGVKRPVTGPTKLLLFVNDDDDVVALAVNHCSALWDVTTLKAILETFCANSLGRGDGGGGSKRATNYTQLGGWETIVQEWRPPLEEQDPKYFAQWRNGTCPNFIHSSNDNTCCCGSGSSGVLHLGRRNGRRLSSSHGIEWSDFEWIGHGVLDPCLGRSLLSYFGTRGRKGCDCSHLASRRKRETLVHCSRCYCSYWHRLPIGSDER
jgi:hypothetical protein